jgi:hypothetical protein
MAGKAILFTGKMVGKCNLCVALLLLEDAGVAVSAFEAVIRVGLAGKDDRLGPSFENEFHAWRYREGLG